MTVQVQLNLKNLLSLGATVAAFLLPTFTAAIPPQYAGVWQAAVALVGSVYHLAQPASTVVSKVAPK